MSESKIETVKLSHLKHLIEVIETRANAQGADPSETVVGFEFLIGSCFPKAWENMQKHLNQTFMDGYVQGREDTLKEVKNES